jgi:hypothetical protein
VPFIQVIVTKNVAGCYGIEGAQKPKNVGNTAKTDMTGVLARK